MKILLLTSLGLLQTPETPDGRGKVFGIMWDAIFIKPRDDADGCMNAAGERIEPDSVADVKARLEAS